MNGTYLRFYVHENVRHKHSLLYEWLLQHAKGLGVYGGSVFRAVEGFGRHGVLHSAHFFELAGEMTMEIEIHSYQRDGRSPARKSASRGPQSGLCPTACGVWSHRLASPQEQIPALTEIYSLATLWLGLALVATLVSIWLRIARPLRCGRQRLAGQSTAKWPSKSQARLNGLITARPPSPNSFGGTSIISKKYRSGNGASRPILSSWSAMRSANSRR